MPGEIAPLKAWLLPAEMVPCCRTVALAGSSSYQRTTDGPLGPATVCWVHTAIAPPASGSAWATAFVSRASELSRVLEVPGCGTFDGTANEVTVMLPSETTVGAVDVPPTCQASILLAVPDPGSRAATT